VIAETREVLATVASHGMVLATGLSAREILRGVDAALAEGSEEIVVTQSRVPLPGPRGRRPSSGSPGAEPSRALFHAPHTGKVTGMPGSTTIRAVAVEQLVLSTDLGQVFNPPVEDGVALWATA